MTSPSTARSTCTTSASRPPRDQTNCIALDNFWRSLSNLTINVTGGTGCQAATDFWAVSQAAPMRRVSVNGKLSLMDYCNGAPDYASGGFIADSAFSGSTIVNGSQQQFIVRNSNMDGWSNGVWNQVFSGDIGAPPTIFPPTAAGGPYTTLPTSPVTQEEPFLQTDAAGNYSVFVPALQHNSSGTTWQSGAAAGTSVPISKFFIATPSTPVLAIDAALALGKNLILTPGVYDLKAPVLVTRPNTIVLGLGFPTLVPQNGTAAMQVLGVPGVKLSGMIFDAGPKNSPVLLQVGGPLALPLRARLRPAVPPIPRWCRTCSSASAGPQRARPPTAWWSTAPTSSSTTSGPGARITVRAWAGPATPPTPASSSTATM